MHDFIDDELRDEMQSLLPKYGLSGIDVADIPDAGLVDEIQKEAEQNLGRA